MMTMTMTMTTAMAGLAGLLLCAAAQAGCPADALGTARTLTLPRAGAAYGTVQHGALPLAPGEVVLTFDDGPRPGSTDAVLAALARECVRATFFVNGGPLRQHPELGDAIARAGHSLGMHGDEHPHFNQLEPAAQLADLARIQDTFAQRFGYAAPAFRFPFLEETPALLARLREQRVTVMSIDHAIDDWLPDQSPEVLTARLLERLPKTRGGIVLLHDAQDQTAAALPRLLRALREGGYKVVHVAWER